MIRLKSLRWLLIFMKKLYRVRKSEEFSSIISRKKSTANAFFVVYSSDRAKENARVGISVSKKLGNEGFLAKAPEKLIEAEKEKLRKAQEKMDKIMQSIKAFS